MPLLKFKILIVSTPLEQNITSCNFLFTDIIVGFQSPQYQVGEGESVPVCVVILSGTSDISFTLELSVTADAECKLTLLPITDHHNMPFCS